MYFSKSRLGFYLPEIHGSSIPADAVEITTDEHHALLEGQAAGLIISADDTGHPVLVAPPPLSPEQIKGHLTAAVQDHLDAVAQDAGYDNIFTACTYADEPSVPQFQAEGQALRAWRSEVWAACHQIMDDVQAGQRQIPTAEELVSALPVPVLP